MLKNTRTAITAIFVGLYFCLFRSEVRRLALWPWLIGALCYIASISAAFYLHPKLLSLIISAEGGVFHYLLYTTVWLLLALMLLASTMLCSVVLVMILTSVFQGAIGRQVLICCSRTVPEQEAGVTGNLKEIIRVIAVESLKLLWILPLLAALFVLGFVPIFAPFVLLLGAWLLGYQFVDVILDLYLLKAKERFTFSVANSLLLVSFGITLTLLWSIPFFGILLAPAATAGAAWMLCKAELIGPSGIIRKK